ncbi:MAG: hypothetical protein WAQ27_02680 [Candidatus Microsaccharimonas sp.]
MSQENGFFLIQMLSTADGVIWFILLLVLTLLPTILCIVLFFKIWVMTNDVGKIKNLLQEQFDLEHPYVEQTEKDDSKPVDKEE